MRELSFLNKGLRLKITDERNKDKDDGPKTEEFFSEGGLVQFVKYLDENPEADTAEILGRWAGTQAHRILVELLQALREQIGRDVERQMELGAHRVEEATR